MLNFKYSALTSFLTLPLLLLLSSASEAAPTYSDHYCTPGTVFTSNSTFQSNLNLLLSSLSSNASLHNGFYRTTVSPNTPDVINGLFLCRGDVNATVCQDCITAASEEIIRRCPNQTQSIIWYDVCMLRYSNKSFNNIIPGMGLTDGNNVSSSDMERFNDLLASFLNDLAAKAANSQSEKKIAAGEMKFTTSEMIYGLAQCVPDLSSSDCNTVFQSAIGMLPTCCAGKLGATVLLPGANIRYEPYTFYNAAAVLVLPPSSSGKSNSTVIVAIVVPFVFGVALFVLCNCYLSRRASKKHKAFQEDSIVDDLQSIESLQFELATIEAATNMFSDEKKIGQGGFGMVYKGTLPNGQEIAVKRLSESSMQGTIEFKNEAALVAKLQHRNLVRLLGFCLEGKEKILIYEYIPNMSLDRFIFDPDGQRELDWSTRYNIIVGIAWGILYLHEDSRLKIIHRDLKASNVLLDSNMNAKISDFGMAKIFLPDQSQGNARTGRIVGTFGYMSPEYAMHGRYSVKSDVFSFGVLALEIVSGKRNSNFYQSNLEVDLLSYAWKTWTNGTPLQLLDPSLGDSYPRNEVIRCIHIGLLCVQENPADRPSMATVALMLNSYSLTMSNPRQPPSFLRERKIPDRLRYRLDSGLSSSTKFPLSLNEASITELYPR